MKEELQRLYRLQQLDAQLQEAKAALAALTDGTAEAADLAAAQEKLTLLRRRQTEHEAARRDKELELGGTEDKLKQSTDRAYGGTVSSPKELESLEMEIEALSRTKDRLEEAILELLDRLDEDAREISQQERIVAELAREVDSIRETYSRETQRLSTEIDSLERQRQDVAQHISARTLAHYDKLREKNSNLGIVRVIDGVCEGCNVRVALSKMQRLETLGNETFCDNCKRYLYLEK